ncbi:MAG: translation initiation factor IF-3 [Actinobacteria bacterium HGW-Actinobacteria-7]|jgi:translation initiation factor IF-3|nr:MAG: translation initiation factor IF-3 [Actinobacteria bacterium HGW-Actinobacteria-7]
MKVAAWSTERAEAPAANRRGVPFWLLRTPVGLDAAGVLFCQGGSGRSKDRHGGELPISSTEYRLNDRIRASSCRLIGFDGSQLGIFAMTDALRIADEQGFDLVEIAPTADPPVCKIMDFGKFKYEQSMKEKAARKNQSKIEIKEMKFRPKVDKHDYETKKKHILRFLDAGAKVKVTIMFRGREMAHPELGLNILERLAGELAELAIIETQPKLEGRNMHMLLAPLKKAPEKAAKEDEPEAAEVAAETE